MGKVILEFDSVEEQDEIKKALDGYKWALAMWDLDNQLRSVMKYSGDDVSEDVVEFAEKLRDDMRGILTVYGLSLEH
jgi:hypothetical protein